MSTDLDQLMIETRRLDMDLVWMRCPGVPSGFWEARYGGVLVEIGTTPAKLLKALRAAVRAPARARGVQ